MDITRPTDYILTQQDILCVLELELVAFDMGAVVHLSYDRIMAKLLFPERYYRRMLDDLYSRFDASDLAEDLVRYGKVGFVHGWKKSESQNQYQAMYNINTQLRLI